MRSAPEHRRKRSLRRNPLREAHVPRNHPVIADAYAPKVCRAAQLFGSTRPWFCGKPFNFLKGAVEN